MNYKLIVRNLAQKILFDMELSGQISDGHWENDETDGRLWGCKTEVFDPSKHDALGCNFIALYPLDFDDPDLHWLLEDRAFEYVKKEVPDYTIEQLHSDLEDLTEIVFFHREV